MVCAPAVVGASADIKEQARHRREAVGVVAPVAAVVGHSGIPAHAHKLPPRRRKSDIDRLGVLEVLREGEPPGVLRDRVFQVPAAWHIQGGDLPVVDKVHTATVGQAELHHIHILVGKRDNNSFARLRVELVATLVKYAAHDRHLLPDRDILPRVDIIALRGGVAVHGRVHLPAALSPLHRGLGDGRGHLPAALRHRRSHNDGLLPLPAPGEQGKDGQASGGENQACFHRVITFAGKNQPQANNRYQ